MLLSKIKKMQEQGLSQREIAKILDTNESQVSRWLKLKVTPGKLASEVYLRRIADFNKLTSDSE